jgi:glycosyltransferase involved in cell wall biosynthesis
VTTVHVVLPEGVDDPARPSGGNTYDRRICAGLAAVGWDVREMPVPGAWPRSDATARRALARRVAALPDGALVLADGLIASVADDVLVPAVARLRLAVLLHMPQEGPAERAVLSAARAVLTASAWSRSRLLARYPLDPRRVRVVHPGVDPAPPAPGSRDGTRLLCVAAVAPHKGHDLLLDALTDLALPWSCTLAGSLAVDPGFVQRLRQRAAASGVADRIRFVGPLPAAALRAEYRAADVLVLASRAETYGMVVAEALAAGLPVIATDVGGVPEALGRTDAGPPGLLVPPGDRRALAAALEAWLGDPALRRGLRTAARARRATLDGWDATVRGVASALRSIAGEPESPLAPCPPLTDAGGSEPGRIEREGAHG